MTPLPEDTARFASMGWSASPALTALLCLHAVACCVSLVYVADLYAYLEIVRFEKSRLYFAALMAAPLAVASVVFTISRFSFGYILGFYFYTMVLGYLWLAPFSRFQYDHTPANVSAFVSALAFLGPALFFALPIKQYYVLSARAFDNLLLSILIFTVAVFAVGAFYNFRLVGVGEIYNFRGGFEFPRWMTYAMGAISNAMLPFAFACFVARGNRLRAATSLLLMLLFYPITLSKLALFAPFWLLFLMLLARICDARTTVVLSLFLPVTVGIILAMLYQSDVLSLVQIKSYFGAINFRMVAFPSVALDVYNDFFSTHSHTYFCQILFLKPFVECPYSEFLSVIMERTYHLGNLNASLFATEGVASVGAVLAPLAALACGLVIAVANGVSSGLPSRFILLSGGILPQVFLNVPLTTTMLTGGAAVLFLLWYLTPRALFEQQTNSSLLRGD